MKEAKDSFYKKKPVQSNEHFECLTKGWFPYDRGSQIADRNKVCDRLRSSAIIWKHTSAIVCDPAIMIADDRRRSQKIEHKGWSPYDRGSQIADRNKVCDRLRSYGNTSAIVCDPAIPCDQLPLCDHMEIKVLRLDCKQSLSG